MAFVGSLRTPARSARLMHIVALRAGAAAARQGFLARGGSALRTKALSVSITAGKPCSPLASLLDPLQCFMAAPQPQHTQINPVGSSVGADSITSPAEDRLTVLSDTLRSVPTVLRTDDDVNVFEARAQAAGFGVLTLFRRLHVGYCRAWVLTHHLGVVKDHSTGRRRALVQPAFHRRLVAVIEKLRRGEQLTHRLDKAAEKWIEEVCVSKTSLELKAPYGTLAKEFMYKGGDGCGTETGSMLICAPAALLYKTQQLLCCRGVLPSRLKGAAACFFADHAFNEKENVGMGQAIMLENSVIRGALAEGKDQWAGAFAEGLATSFQGVFVVGMHCPHYRGFADKYGLPDVRVIDWSGLGPDDFSRSAEATRSAAFQRIFDACRAHGVLGPGDELLLVSALGLVRDGKSDLIEALEISNVVPLGDGEFQVRGNPRAFEKLKSWPADLPAARALRDALAPNMGVAAFLGACKFVPVPDSAQIKSRHRRHRRDSLVDLCTGIGGGAGRGRRNRLVRQEGLRAGALPHQGQDGAVDAGQRPGARPHLLQPLLHGADAEQGRRQRLRVRRVPVDRY